MRVPRENLIGEEGKGLKIALITLNTGRLTLPAACAGIAQAVPRDRAAAGRTQRVQWGVPIGKHEAIAHKIADMAATTFAMESVASSRAQMADRGGYDIRLEAAAAKEWNTVRALGDRRRDAADPRRPRLRDRALARGRAASTPIPVERDDARLPHQPDLRGLERDHAPVHGARGGRQAPRRSRAR